MDYAVNIISLIQVFFAIIIGLYFWNLLKSQRSSKTTVAKESQKEMDNLTKLREISLTEPLAEKTRPSGFEDIIGQEDALKALRAALCGANPQHVIVYGPPGVGKTAAARLVLAEAQRNPLSPFKTTAKFVELDATTARFDERGIADPLIGTVHDPIYQGAGQLGVAGVPQPKPGAVTKAHGGVLFIDEIGELHHVQMNKLLKVLEDRKVFFESSYYSSEDLNIPNHIHDIFKNGLPADFRLIGATTRMPSEIPPAIRSRCIEVFFRPLLAEQIGQVAQTAAKKINFEIEEEALSLLKSYAKNGREAVNMVQIAASIVQNKENINITISEAYQQRLKKDFSKRDISANKEEKVIAAKEMQWVINFGQYTPRLERKISSSPKIGVVNALAVSGANVGMLLELEASATLCEGNNGTLRITGVVEEEEIAGFRGHTMKRKSMAKGSLDNVLTVLNNQFNINTNKYNIHVNFPGGIPIDGPSAGVAVFIVIYSAITKIPIDNTIAMTGEISIHGCVKPVGGVSSKIEAAKIAGAKKVFIPKENWQEEYGDIKEIEVIKVETINEILIHALKDNFNNIKIETTSQNQELLVAAGIGGELQVKQG
ncbi:AAA family ATPase [Selenomonadales bacterium OttesenSCG-928-I06]|nr:AAA family ATPase [Selenomonadales bacterium OttesenSCG-928-I06]